MASRILIHSLLVVMAIASETMALEDVLVERENLTNEYKQINELLSESSVRVNMDTVNSLLAQAEEAGSDMQSSYVRALRLISALDQITLVEVCQQKSRQLIRDNNLNVLPEGVWWETSGKQNSELTQIEKLVKYYYDWFNKTCPGADSIHNDPKMSRKSTFAQRMRAVVGRRGYY